MIDTNHQEQAVALISKVLDNACSDWTEQEITVIVQHLALHLLEMSSTCYELADLIEHWISTNNSIEEFNRLGDNLRNTSLEQIIQAAEYLSLSEETVIISGNKTIPGWNTLQLQKLR